jgi:uncharacterized PurR-regulated membrane protein YhhQ (DUF165 family)
VFFIIVNGFVVLHYESIENILNELFGKKSIEKNIFSSFISFAPSHKGVASSSAKIQSS